MHRPTATRFERVELKQVVDEATRAALVRDLEERLAPDPHGDAQGLYSIATLYHDSPTLDAFWDHALRRPVRHKLRVRVYGAEAWTGGSFVEIKQRWGGRVAKRRLALPLPDAMALCALRPTETPLDPAGAEVASEVRRLVAERSLRPTCLVRYRRQAFVGTGGEADLRVTIDSDLLYRFHDLAPTDVEAGFDGRVLPADESLVEVKVDDAVPYWLSLLLARRGCTLQSVSKYALAVAREGLAASPPLASSGAASRRAVR